MMSENPDGDKNQVSLAKESAISWASIHLKSYLYTMKMMRRNRNLSELVT